MTRSLSLTELINDKKAIIDVVKTILENAPVEAKRIRLLGVGVSNFELAEKKKGETNIQLNLFK